MLTIYAPFSNPKSKAWEVFNGVKKTWPTKVFVADNSVEQSPDTPCMFWGLVNHNLDMITYLKMYGKQDWWYTDAPYFGRFNNKNLKPDNHWWRISKNGIHVPLIEGCPSDRFKKFDVKINDIRKKGEHILICPSSYNMQNCFGENNWHVNTMHELSRYTDRPLKWREKPRGRGTSGPSEADVPLSEDLKNAWAVVTSVSTVAVEAIAMGIPVFCHPSSFAAPITNTNLADIENPNWQDPTDWFNSLCYQQFTPEEFDNGVAVKILQDLKIL
jgi:hypothetical protein